MSVHVEHPVLNIREVDGSPSTYPYIFKVPNTSLTDNGDGSVTLAFVNTAISGLTEDRVLFGHADGSIDQDSNITYDGTRLTVNNITVGNIAVASNSLLAYSSATAIIATGGGVGTGITANTSTGSAGIFNRSGDGGGSALLYLNSYGGPPGGGVDTAEILLIRNEGSGDSFVLHDGTSNRFDITKTGVLEWWTAPYGAVDTNLYRGGVDLLKTDDTFQAAALITGSDIFFGTDQTDRIYSDDLHLILNAESATRTIGGRVVNTDRYTSNQTLDSNNHIVAGDTDGGAFTITFPVGIDGTHYITSNVGRSGNALTISPDEAELLGGVNEDFDILDGETIDWHYETTEGWIA